MYAVVIMMKLCLVIGTLRLVLSLAAMDEINFTLAIEFIAHVHKPR